MQGFALAIKIYAIRDHHVTSTAINKRLMTPRLPLPKENDTTLIFAYVSTLDADEEAKYRF